MTNVRKLVARSLLNCHKHGKFAEIEANNTLSRNNLTTQDKALYLSLFYGVIERQITIDYQISKLSSIPVSQIDDEVMIFLRVGIYQILYANGIKNYAAISETVECAKNVVSRGAVPFINGILRSATTKIVDENGYVSIFTPKKEKDLSGFLSINYAYPRFLVDIWRKQYGDEVAEKIMIAQNIKPPITLRVNALKLSREEYAEILHKNGIVYTFSQYCNDGIIIENGSVTALPFFEEGYFFVQDDASRLCVATLDPQQGETIIDACACPGGKSFAISIAMKNSGKVISCDLHDSKISLISSGAKRLGIEIIDTRVADSSIFCKNLPTADRVLCDVPCSGFGTIAKKPNLRHKSKEDVLKLPEIQRAILENCSRYVRTSGTLVYSTCTINREENEKIVEAFLAEHAEFSLVMQRQLLPHETATDGFFFAKMTKNG